MNHGYIHEISTINPNEAEAAYKPTMGHHRLYFQVDSAAPSQHVKRSNFCVPRTHFEACSLWVWFKILPKNGWSDAGHEQFFVNMSVPKPGSVTNSRRTCCFTSFLTWCFPLCTWSIGSAAMKLGAATSVPAKDGYVASQSLLQCLRGKLEPESFVCEPGAPIRRGAHGGGVLSPPARWGSRFYQSCFLFLLLLLSNYGTMGLRMKWYSGLCCEFDVHKKKYDSKMILWYQFSSTLRKGRRS